MRTALGDTYEFQMVVDGRLVSLIQKPSGRIFDMDSDREYRYAAKGSLALVPVVPKPRVERTHRPRRLTQRQRVTLWPSKQQTTCLNCGKTLNLKRPDQKYCGQNCKKAASRKKTGKN